MTLSRGQVLGQVPEPLREPARHALDWLLPDGEELDALAAYDVLHFVWYQLPTKWMIDGAELAEVVQATAAVLDAAGRRRLADLVRDPRTVEIQVAWRAERSRAVKLYERAMADSGYAPPDTDLLVWGAVMDAPVVVPDGAAAPLRWLCDRVGAGLTMTQAGYLPTSVVAEAKELWYADWVLPGFATRSESDLPPLMILREFAQVARPRSRLSPPRRWRPGTGTAMAPRPVSGTFPTRCTTGCARATASASSPTVGESAARRTSPTPAGPPPSPAYAPVPERHDLPRIGRSASRAGRVR